MNNKVLLGMSGGVDSSAAAILLKEKGYDVIGVTMKLWEDEFGEQESSCCSLSATADAKRVCDILKIPHYTLNFKKVFKEKVIDNFIYEYSNQRTPNPCIECNKHLKFDCMYQMAKELQINYIATGHYAKIEYSKIYNKYVLKKAKNLSKDQSYVLYNIPQELLEKIIFPLGDFETKQEIREIAKINGLHVSKKPDSQEICFIPDGNYKEFLENNSKLKPKLGNIVNAKGEILGQHDGLYRYTIGQRKGLKIPYKVRLFVIGFNKEKNELIVGEENELYKQEIIINNINLLLIDDLAKPMKVNVKTRYTANEAEAIIEKLGEDLIKVTFDKPQPRLTPGQSAVFYIDDIVLGGGKIYSI